jgi:hypothetical protein
MFIYKLQLFVIPAQRTAGMTSYVALLITVFVSLYELPHALKTTGFVSASLISSIIRG